MNNPANRSLLSLNRESRPGAGLEERLHKVLANAGLGSRRLLEERIGAGEIRVNGSVAEVGTLVRGGDRVEVDGKAFMTVTAEPDEIQTLIYNKPEGEITTNDDPEGRPTVFERLPRLKGARWVSIGRLDINTTGLLLLTTDGELAHAMMHPSHEVEREYICRIHGQPTEETLARLKSGVQLEDGMARFDEIAVISLGESHSWFRVLLREGRNREVRRLWESQGMQVSRLKRIRYGSVELPRELRRGHYQIMPAEDYRALRTQLGLPESIQILTLQPVIGVRKASKQTAYKGDQLTPEAWSGGRSDEARELRAFDFVREERPAARPRRRNKAQNKPRTGGANRGPSVRRQPGSGATMAQTDRPMRHKRQRTRPGQEQNPAALRSWSPGTADNRGYAQPGGRGKSRPKKPMRSQQSNLPYGFPSDHAYAQRFEEYKASPGNAPQRPGRFKRRRGRQPNP